MRGKTGYLRNMNSIVVEGSLKMVISPARHNSEKSVVYIPKCVAESTKVPKVVNGVIESCVEDGDYGIFSGQEDTIRLYLKLLMQQQLTAQQLCKLEEGLFIVYYL